MNAIIYTRFSPRRNSDTSESCETQEAMCRECAAVQGWAVGAVYADKGMSGSCSDRPGLSAALAALRRGDVLLVYKRDRLARDVLIAELTRRQVKAAGATIAAVSGDIAGDDSDPTVMFVRQIMDAVAELERKQIAARTSDTMLQYQRDGRRIGRYAPYGYRIDPETAADPDVPTMLLPIPAEQKALDMVRIFVAGGMGIVQICTALNKAMPTSARTGEWSYNTVKRILIREKVLVKSSDGGYEFIAQRQP